jgi:cytochrome c5
VAHGKEALFNIALKGKPGTAMMAKGGRVDLPDADIKSDVDFMVHRVK